MSGMSEEKEEVAEAAEAETATAMTSELIVGGRDLELLEEGRPLNGILVEVGIHKVMRDLGLPGGGGRLFLFPSYFYQLLRRAEILVAGCDEVQPAQDGPGIAVSDARAKRALSRLAVCLETLYAGGMHRARRWVVPICRKLHWLCVFVDLDGRAVFLADSLSGNNKDSGAHSRIASRMVHFARTAEQLAAEVAAIERAAEEDEDESIMNGKLAAPPLPPPSGKPWPVRVMEVEQQSEGDDADCGVHVVNNVARFIKDHVLSPEGTSSSESTNLSRQDLAKHVRALLEAKQ